MEKDHLSYGVIGEEAVYYNGKNYRIPLFDIVDPIIISPEIPNSLSSDFDSHPILQSLGRNFDLREFSIPRLPISAGFVDMDDRALFTSMGVQRTLDMPIKMPGNIEFRIPRALSQFSSVIRKMISFEVQINPDIEEYFAYITVDQSTVRAGDLQREAPCHVDGFQGARWQPKVKGSHTYTVSDVLPTAYYHQSFDFSQLDERIHDIFWEMNAQVADTAEKYKWQPEPWEITLMDCYCVHRGVGAETDTDRTWLRLTFEEKSRIYDRLGNAHNPLFDYEWEMVPRDIEQLGLVALRAESDPSLRVFPWQDVSGKPLASGAKKTQPKLS